MIRTGFIGTVDELGGLNLYDGTLRLMRADGGHTDLAAAGYADFIAEKVVDHSYGKFPYARCWNEGFSLDPDAPKGIYRANTLARINAADHIPTPRAQAELEEFREKFGRPRPPCSTTGPASSKRSTPANGPSKSWKTRKSLPPTFGPGSNRASAAASDVWKPPGEP